MDATPKKPLALQVLKTLAKALAVIIGVLAVLIGLLLWPQSEWIIDLRKARIRGEVSNLAEAHPWAGHYGRSYGHGGESLWLAPEAGFQQTKHGCLELEQWDHGSVEANGTRLVLHKKWAVFPAGNWELQVVEWGARRYLVEPKDLLEFVNRVNMTPGDDPSGMYSFFLRDGDLERPVSGRPNLPEEYARLILSTRLEGHVTAVAGQDPSLGDDQGLGTVDLDLGLEQGAFEGMELYLVTETSGFATAVLFEVASDSSRATVNYRDSFSPPPAVGWKAASRLGD